MGFNKKFISENMINEHIINQESLEELFNADAFIFTDNVSSRVYQLFCDGMSIDNITNEIKKYYESKSI
jgi:hypothetical protein